MDAAAQLKQDVREGRVDVQGQRSLSRYSSEGFDEEFVVPSAGTAFHDQAVFAWMLFQ